MLNDFVLSQKSQRICEKTSRMWQEINLEMKIVIHVELGLSQGLMWGLV